MRHNDTMKPTVGSRTILLGIGSLVGLLIAVAVFFALQPSPTFEPSTPEGAAQGYYQALLDGDADLARSYMTVELQGTCEGPFRWYNEEDDTRIVITRTEIEGDRAELDVNITITYGEGPFGGGSYGEDDIVVLERRGNRWLISEPTWPMDRYGCEKDF